MTASTNPKDTRPVKVRFAPSPTGLLHLGGARTALYNYLLARQTGGQFILRIEDTDQKRFDPDAEQNIMDSLHWLGLEWDQGPDKGGEDGPFRQTERKDIHRQYAEKLIEKGNAFYCFCTKEELDEQREQQKARGEQPHYAGPCRNYTKEEAQARVDAGEEHVIRFKMPKEGSITVHDRIRGDITFDHQNLDDYILLKSDGLAVYHLAAMVDDHLMGITHVFRGEEWIPTFPLHVHIYEAFGWEQPEWVHLSLFLKPSGKGKMSKRETEEMRLTGQTIFINDMPELGYLPEAVVNWIALMGWSYDDKTEFFTMNDLIEKFSIDKLNPSNAAIDFKKFDHFNGLHIRDLSVDDLAKRLLPFYEAEGYHVSLEDLIPVAPLLQLRLPTLDEAPSWTTFLFKEEVTPAAEDLVAKNMTAAESLAVAKRVYQVLESIPEFTHDSLEKPLRDLVEELGVKAGQLFGIMRVAITAQQVSPPLFESMELLPRDTVMQRMQTGIKLLEDLAAQEN